MAIFSPPSMHATHNLLGGQGSHYPTTMKRGDMVPKVLVEEKEQEILTKEETIQVNNN